VTVKEHIAVGTRPACEGRASARFRRLGHQ